MNHEVLLQRGGPSVQIIIRQITCLYEDIPKEKGTIEEITIR